MIIDIIQCIHIIEPASENIDIAKGNSKHTWTHTHTHTIYI